MPEPRPAVLITGQNVVENGRQLTLRLRDCATRLLKDPRFGDSFGNISLACDIDNAFHATDVVELTDEQWKALVTAASQPQGAAKYDPAYAQHIKVFVGAILNATTTDPRTAEAPHAEQPLAAE